VFPYLTITRHFIDEPFENDVRVFKKTLGEESKGLLWPMDYKKLGMVLAGGCVLPILSSTTIDYNDFDLFLVGHKTLAESRQAIVDFAAHLTAVCGGVDPITVRQTSTSVTFLCRKKIIQVILRQYNTLAEVLHGFDLGACAMGFDGNEVWTTELGKIAFESRVNILCLDGRRATYESRLAKYFERDFGLVLRGFEMSCLNELPVEVEDAGADEDEYEYDDEDEHEHDKRKNQEIYLPRLIITLRNNFGLSDNTKLAKNIVARRAPRYAYETPAELPEYENTPSLHCETRCVNKWNLEQVLTGRLAGLMHQYVLSGPLNLEPCIASITDKAREELVDTMKRSIIQFRRGMPLAEINAALGRVDDAGYLLARGIEIPFVMRAVTDGTLLTKAGDENAVSLPDWYGPFFLKKQDDSKTCVPPQKPLFDTI
jgi:hypothetical protein